MAFSSDLDQLTRAASGERGAVSALVARYSPGVFGLSKRMLGDAAEAEDVTQETFIRAWKALPTWEPRANFSSWLHRVALNLCYDRLRKRREVIMAEPPEQMDRELRPDERLEQTQQMNAIEKAIADLPERQAAALNLCAIEGHSQKEAADILEISQEALESLLARARRTLRKTGLASARQGQ